MATSIDWLLLIGGAFVGATLAAVTGFGGAAILLPLTVMVFGVRDAVPILTVAQLIGNASRVWFNRTHVSYGVVRWFALGAVPAAVAGSLLFASAPVEPLKRVLGAFLLLMVAGRRFGPRALGHIRLPLAAFAGIGAGSGFLSALLGSVGPLMAPFFLAVGLVKDAYIGTEALATVIVHATKLVTYQQVALLTPANALAGVMLGPVMILGSIVGKSIVGRLSESTFVALVEGTLLVAGLGFLTGRW